MMLLDIGNSSLKWRLQAPDGHRDGGCFTHAGRDFRRQAAMAWGHLPEPGCVVAANVAGPALETAIGAWLQENWQVTAAFIRAQAAAAGVINGYAAPQTLGADRWAALIAARHAHPDRAVCVVDCGTAITLDLLDAAGLHRGGLIVPGLEMMRHALFTDTAGVRPEDGVEDSPAPAASIPLARATQAAVDNGVLYMARALLERAIADITADNGADTAIVMTGGDATRLLPLAGRQPHHDPDLVLNGLAILAGELQCVT